MKRETNATLSPTEAIVDWARASGPECVGPQRTGRYLMVGGCVSQDPRNDNKPRFYDLFLTRAQAAQLHAEIGRILETYPDEVGI